MGTTQLKIFVSSIGVEKFPLRKSAFEALNEASGIATQGFEYLPSQADTPQQTCLREVAACEIYLGVFGLQYSAPTSEEYFEAKRLERPRLVFVEAGVPSPEQQLFLDEVLDWKSGQFVHKFDDANSLKYEILRALNALPRVLEWTYLKNIQTRFTLHSLFPLAKDTVEVGALEFPNLILHQADGQRTPLSPLEAIRQHQRILVLAPSGHGKSTLLRVMAHSIATDTLLCRARVGEHFDPARFGADGEIPILLTVADIDGQLDDSVRTECERFGMRWASDSAFTSWFQSTDIVLLLDGLDQGRQAGRLLQDLSNLRYDNIKVALSTQPIATAIIKSLPRFSTTTIDSWSDHALRAIFKLHLGDEASADLLQTVHRYHLSDSLRTPLMANALAVSWSIGDQNIPSPAAMYNTIFESARRAWVEAKSDKLSVPEFDDSYAKLERFAFYTLKAERTKSVVSRWSKTEHALSGEIEREFLGFGLLVKSSTSLVFAHDSYRDYFAARYIARNLGSLQAIALMIRPEWRSVAQFWVGLSSDTHRTRLLEVYELLQPLAKWLCTSSPHELGTHLLLTPLLLGIGSESPNSSETRRHMLSSLELGTRSFYIGYKYPRRVTYFASDEDRYASFYALIGEFGLDDSLVVLDLMFQQRSSQRYVLFGYGAIKSESALKRLLAYVSFDGSRQDFDSLAHSLAGELCLRFAPELFLKTFAEFCEQSSPLGRGRLMDAFVKALVRGRSKRGDGSPQWFEGQLADAWIRQVTEIYFQESDSFARGRAEALLHQMGGDRLPKHAEDVSLNWLENTAAPAWQRIRAMALVHTFYTKIPIERYLDWVDDPEPWVGMLALEHLLYRAREAFPSKVAHFVAREGSLTLDSHSLGEAIRIDIAAESMDEPARAECELLLLGLLCGTEWPLRSLCSDALRETPGEKTVNKYLEVAFLGDCSTEVRIHALRQLCHRVAPEVDTLLLRALEDESRGVRLEGIRQARVLFEWRQYTPTVVVKESIAKLESLDSDSEIQREAHYALGRIAEIERTRSPKV